MNRRYGTGAAIVLGLLAAYYLLPLALIIITLGTLCPYSPLGIPMCTDTTNTSGPPPTGRAKAEAIAARLCKRLGDHFAGATTDGDELCFTVTPDMKRWVEISITFAPGSGCTHETGG